MPGPRVHRRRFLQAASAGAAAGAVSQIQPAGAQPPPARTRVAIIGAGMGGIATGYFLRSFGIDSIVIEGRDRLGGRIWTSTRWPDAPLDLGAAFIHDSPHSPLTPLAKSFNIETREVDFSNFVFRSVDGVNLNPVQVAQILGIYGLMLAQVTANGLFLQSVGIPDQPISTQITNVLGRMRLPASVYPGLNVALDLLLRTRYASELTDLSLYNYRDGNVIGNHDLAFPRGYVQLVEQLAAGQQVYFGQIVKRILYSERGVTIETNQSVFCADFAVVTLPLGVLRNGSVAFLPPLPDWKQGAINRLHTGTIDKLVLRFPRAFWDTQRVYILRMAPVLGQYVLWLKAVPIAGKPIFMVFVSGNLAVQIEGMADNDVVNLLMRLLRQWYPGQNIPNPVDFQRSRWGADPFVQGPLSHVPPGSSPADYDVLAEPVPYAPNLGPSANRLYFAGEATNRTRPNNVWGVFESGMREASRIKNI